MADRRVLILGIGDSACDIAVETSRVSRRTFLATRRGAHILPKYLFGVPTDHLTGSWLAEAPLSVQERGLQLLLRLSRGRLKDYGLPTPRHRVLGAHPPHHLRRPAVPPRPRRHRREARPRELGRGPGDLRGRERGGDRRDRLPHGLRHLDDRALYFVSYDGLVNNHAFQKNALLTHHGFQYAADRDAVVSRRAPGASTWQTAGVGHRLRYDDSHNVICMGVSGTEG
ncbi:hypothetical protein OG819_50265 [Streptomyces sp. NBC_01549]|nr:hypothetical protein [Streptomyces sp. NBC_01549]MCX4597473.1 hypothetical protein [Streptomyces sp. NBC_01549]